MKKNDNVDAGAEETDGMDNLSPLERWQMWCRNPMSFLLRYHKELSEKIKEYYRLQELDASWDKKKAYVEYLRSKGKLKTVVGRKIQEIDDLRWEREMEILSIPGIVKVERD